MQRMEKSRRWVFGFLGAAFLGTMVPLMSGCQLSQNGQTLPSPFYLDNSIQYFPEGNDFQHQQEVDRMKKEAADRDLTRSGGVPSR